jgi:dimethylamine/trimethylamine dehydrogenase
MTYTGEAVDMLPLLHRLGVRLLPSHVVTSIEPGRVAGCLTIAPAEPLQWDVDAVVLTTQRVASSRLYRELTGDPAALERNGIRGVYRVGDCHAPRQQVADAIFDGHRLAREIDSDDPGRPLPWKRERALVYERGKPRSYL